MDPASQKRVRERKARPSKVLKELSLSPSSSPPRRRRKAGGSSQRQKKQENEEKQYWRLGEPAVLREEQREDGRYLLLNWADIDPATGKKYKPTWEKDTQAAVADWDERKAAGAEGQKTEEQQESTEASLPDSQDSQVTQPIRAATRKRNIRRGRSRSQIQPETRGRAGTNATARVQSASGRSVDREIHDTYKEAQLTSSRQSGPEIRVEVAVPDGFDRSLYAIGPTSSQSSQPVETSQSVAQSAHSSLRTPRVRTRQPFIWDEDIAVVPDSVEQPGSSSYNTSSSAHTRTSLPINFGTETFGESSSKNSGPGASQTSIGNLRSQSVSDSLAEPQSFLARVSYNNTQTTSTQAFSSSRSVGNISRGTAGSKNPTEEESQNILLPSRQIDEGVPNFEVQSSQHNLLYSQIPQRQRSDHQISGRQNIDRPKSARSDSLFSEQFLTQIPPLSPPPFSSSRNFSNTNPPDESQQLPPISRIHTHPIQDNTRKPDSVTLSAVSQLQQSLPVSQAAPSSFEATWAAAKVISSTPQSAQFPGTSHIAASLSASSQGLSKSIETPHPSLNYNSQQSRSASRGQASQSKSSEGQHSQSSHLPSPPSEDVLPSIEHPLRINSPGPTRHATPPSSDAISASSPIRPMHEISSMDPSVKQEDGDYDSKAALKEKMEARKIKIRAAQEQRERDRLLSTASPSPAIIVNQAAVHQEPELSNRLYAPMRCDDTVVANGVDEQAQDDPLASNIEQPSASLDVLPTRSDEFLVPLPMVAFVRDVYNRTLRENRNLTALLMKEDMRCFDEEKIGEVDALLENLRRICDHQDTFDDGSSTQQSSTPLTNLEQAQWAETCSTKCMFLTALLARLQSRNLHLVVVARPEVMEFLQDMCQLHGLNPAIAGKPPPNVGSSSLKITLHPAGIQMFPIAPPSVVIAFSCVSRDLPLLRDIRHNPDQYSSGLAPLISLVVTHSIEHLDRCFDGDVDPIQKRIRLVKCLRQLEDSMGQMKGEYEDPTFAANAVAEYLENGSLADSWPLPPMPEIDDIELSPEYPQLDSSQEPNAGLMNNSHNLPQGVVLQPGLKRQIEDTMDTGSPKRQRFTPVPSDPAVDMNISHVSDSVVQQSSTFQRASTGPASSKAGSQSRPNDQVTSLLNRIKHLEIKLQEKEVTEARLRQLNNELEAGRKDLMQSIVEIQPKYQDALNDRGHFEHEITQALVRETGTNKRIAAQTAEITKLKEKNVAIALELSAARQALATSAVPEIAEMANLKEKISKLEAENERLQKSASYLQNQVEYMRTSYQNASTAAAESASELQELQATTVELQAKADANTVRIHELQRDQDVSNHVSTIKRLRSEKEDLEKECERRGEKIEALTNKRSSGRTPVPRSPRIGGAMSPGPIRNVGRNFRAGSAGGSRGNSPAPGDLFGGNLDGTTVARGGSVRWGNHLQQ